MATELKTQMKNHEVSQFWGGDEKGKCVQIQCSAPLTLHSSSLSQIQEEGYIVLDMEEAVALCNTLGKYVQDEAQRRQNLLREQIASFKDMEKTVFREVADLSPDWMKMPRMSISLVSRLCPVSRKQLQQIENVRKQ